MVKKGTSLYEYINSLPQLAPNNDIKYVHAQITFLRPFCSILNSKTPKKKEKKHNI
jgi:hypothetical protein